MLVNIYLTDAEKLKLNELSNKYKVSISTIADNVLKYLTKYLLADNRKDVIYLIDNASMYDRENNKKTSIKPKGEKEKDFIKTFYKNLNRAYINSIKIYVNKDIKKYLTEKNANMFYQELNTSLQKTYEPNYNYNAFRRNIARYERKQNNG